VNKKYGINYTTVLKTIFIDYKTQHWGNQLPLVRGVRGLGWIGFGLIRYPTRSIFIGLGSSTNPHFHYQIRTEPTQL
jgi:hypothetical protein